MTSLIKAVGGIAPADTANHLNEVLRLGRALAARAASGSAPFPTETEALARDLFAYAARHGNPEGEREARKLASRRQHVDPADIEWV
jgi:hypothetical protein